MDDLALKSDINNMEHLFVELSVGPGGRYIIVCVIYRTPDSSIQDCNDTLANLVDLINNEHKSSYILGDFNINLLKKKCDTATVDFLNIIYSSNFPLIYKPTRVIENSATLIDYILTNYLREGIKSGVLY